MAQSCGRFLVPVLHGYVFLSLTYINLSTDIKIHNDTATWAGTTL